MGKLSELKTQYLKKELEERVLATTENKLVLQERLREAFEDKSENTGSSQYIIL